MVHWQHTPYNSIFILAVFISIGVLVFAWRHRYERGGRVFTTAMAIIVVWAASDTLQLMATDQSAKLMWRTFAYAAHNLGPIILLVFALIYTGRDAWVTPLNIGILAFEPVLVGFVVTPTTTMHGLIWRGIQVSTEPGYAILEVAFGPWYWINTAYNYVLVLAAIVLFLDMAWGSKTTHRKQGIALVAGIIPPFVGNVSWVAGLTIIDVTALGFALTGAVWGVALFRYRLLDLVPVARHAVLEDIPDGYLVLDEEDRIVDQNAASRSILGDVVGVPARRVLPDSAEILDRPMDEEGETELTFTIDGRRRHYRAQISPLGSREFIGRLVLLRDVTEQRAVKNRYQALIENSSDLIAVLDEDGVMRYMSPSSKRILGYEASTLENTSAFERIHADDVDRTVEEFRKGVEDPDYEPHLEYRYRHQNGSWVWLESRGRNLLDQEPVDGFVVNSRDVTARRQREEELRRQKDRLDEFASVVSHDLRNPLNVIAGRLELAQKFDEPEHLEIAAEATEQMNQLVDELLSLARQGRSVGDTEPVRLEDVAADGWSMAETEAGSLTVDDPEFSLEADRSRLSELFSNLFHNAMVHGGEGVTVRVGALEDGFYVEDDGPGIPGEERESVFDRGFSTGDDGTGLGLAIVEEIVDAHGWTISLTDAVDGGARFEVTGVDTLTPRVAADDD